jgi:AcrR family transcriptional regulator
MVPDNGANYTEREFRLSTGVQAATEPRPLRADAMRNREAILVAAEAEFRERGVDASIDGIAERAGVGVGTVYRNYATKDELMRAIVAAHVEPLLMRARQSLTDPDAGAAFFSFGRSLFADSCEFKALADALAGAGLDIDAAKHETSAELMETMRQLFARAQEQGAIRQDVTMADLGTLIGGLFHGAASATDQRQVTRCFELVCDAIRAGVTA